jgi:hypothetical protein
VLKQGETTLPSQKNVFNLFCYFVIFKNDKEKRDVRGRTPLMLAVTLGHLESARTLLQYATNVNTENREGWTVVQEAVATGDPELLQLVLERRDYQRYSSRVGGIPELLQKLKEAPDFYVEMKWEFTSWGTLNQGLFDCQRFVNCLLIFLLF